MVEWIKENKGLSVALAVTLVAFIAVHVFVNSTDEWEPEPFPPISSSSSDDAKPDKQKPGQDKPNGSSNPESSAEPSTGATSAPSPEQSPDPESTFEPEPNPEPKPEPKPELSSTPEIDVEIPLPGLGGVGIELNQNCVEITLGTVLGAGVNCPRK